MASTKFVLMVSPETFHRLEAKAKRPGVTISTVA